MALIYRSIVEVDDPELVDHAPALALDWLRWKLEQPDLELAPGDVLSDEERGVEMRCVSGADGDRRVLRVTLYENRVAEGEQVASTFTALSSDGVAWAWMDVERWTTSADARPWLAYVPSLVQSVLSTATCSRGPTQLQRRYKLVRPEEVPLLVDAILEPTRVAPAVVVTYHRSEDGTAGAESRAHELMRRIGGIGNVYVLGEGSVTPFSQAMLERAGPFMDAHSGAVRVYLPGAGSDRDYQRRHRYVPWSKLDGRHPDMATRLLAPAVVRSATEIAPPPVWRDHLRALIEHVGQEGRDYQELFELATSELGDRERELEQTRSQRSELEERLTDSELANAELLGALDDLRRRIVYYRSQLAEVAGAAAYAEPEIESFRPLFCSEVVEAARERLDLIEIDASVDEHAAELDEHATTESWAQKAWTAMQALQAYATAKRDGYNGDFKTYCANSAGDVVLPTRWIGLHESDLVRTNQRFRDLRTLPISTEAVAEGRVYMEAHIRIEMGGTPCPRIHFFDDTSGATGKIHIGWFGDHLDSFSKS